MLRKNVLHVDQWDRMQTPLWYEEDMSAPQLEREQ